ncbi:DUF262 domain-containing protein [uncultured Lacinutrix sp.]|uniref:DUF262 domain-containing protein n=1 Tax=uncultured Lacinutrix sp. TaxID=574032 RepID=UPI002633BBEC|nr:DUF262 domain-containing protein [uncultured Lacinutrix sp.]
MSYKSTTIYQVIQDIENSKMFLPAIQRKFVWGKYQIEQLFDSLIKDYPIGTFLFWHLPRVKANEYVFYHFLKKYDIRNPYNSKVESSFLKDEIIGVLDGQQRLSSIYLALQGTYTDKKKYLAWDNPRSYFNSTLHLNLFTLPYVQKQHESLGFETTVIDEDRDFQFLFLDIDKKHKQSSNEFWFNVKDIMLMGENNEVDAYYEAIKKEIENDEIREIFESKKTFIKKALNKLHEKIYKDEIINYFKEGRTQLDDILKIFVRVNSGGTVLSKTDLLFSTIVATWEDGRDKIEKFLSELNSKGEGFNFNNDFLMRCCLVLSDLPVLFRVNSFKSENVQLIKNNWNSIKEALNKTVDLLVSFGFNGGLLASQNSIIIIAYYLIKGGKENSSDVENIKKYLLHSLLKNVYGGQGDQVITSFRSALREKNIDGSYKLKNINFSFDLLSGQKLTANKSLKINKDDIEEFLGYRKGQSSFFVLSLLYPNLRYGEVKFQQDHIHPESRFTDAKLRAESISESKWVSWQSMKDSLPNLQLLESKKNNSKNDEHFLSWLDNSKDILDRDKFCIDNYIPVDTSLEFANFEKFYKKRRKLLKKQLKLVLNIN